MYISFIGGGDRFCGSFVGCGLLGCVGHSIFQWVNICFGLIFVHLFIFYLKFCVDFEDSFLSSIKWW